MNVVFGLTLLAGVLAMTACSQRMTALRNFSAKRLTGAIALGIVLFFASSQSAAAVGPLAALGTSDSAINQEQQAFEEKLKLDPTGGHYSGIEYSDKTVRNQPSDQEILDEIEPQLEDTIVAAVSNGSVRLSGKVEDRATAENIVESVKEIAGVHEVAFNLGLSDNDMQTTR